jgi:antitoxin FitA
VFTDFDKREFPVKLRKIPCWQGISLGVPRQLLALASNQPYRTGKRRCFRGLGNEEKMTSLLIRNVDEALHARLKARAAEHRRSLEEEARELLRSAVARQETASRENLVETARRLFGPEQGVELEIPRRGTGPARAVPDFAVPGYEP